MWLENLGGCGKKGIKEKESKIEKITLNLKKRTKITSGLIDYIGLKYNTET